MIDLNCANCKIEVSQLELECKNCGYPLDETEEEKSIFIGKQIVNKSRIRDAKEFQGKVQNILYLLGAFQIFNAFRAYSNNIGIENVIFFTVFGLLLIAFGFFSKKHSLLFMCLALAIILLYYLMLFLSNPLYFYSGILWKIATICILVYGIVKSMEERNIKKKFDFLKN